MSTKPALSANDNDVFGVTTPSTFPAKKLTFGDKKADDKLTDDKSNDDKSKRDALPTFIVDPVDSFIIRSKPADLSCRVVGADKAYFTCNGEAMAAADRHKEEDRMEVVSDQVSSLNFWLTNCLVAYFPRCLVA